MANMFARFFPSTALVLAALLFPFAATANAVNDCKHTRRADEKLRACSQAIARTNDRDQLERFYLRRGNAYMELKLYADAKRDFSRLIEINPRVAGYFDNRMMASRELGQMQEALDDANREVALASNLAFTHRNRGLLFEKMMDYDRAL
jgi:tetratricopeptide (TPR) repeat protein